MMPKTNFKSLKVCQLAEKLADNLWNIVSQWDLFAKDTIGKQIVRATDSIGANIAEGTGRGSFQDNRRFVRTARGSFYETQYWLRRAHNRKLLTGEQVDELKSIIDELAPRLNAYLKSIGNVPPKQRTTDN